MSWIVCEEGDTTLFEGRHQGRTRGSALKFLKEQIDRKSLSGVVFTITEIYPEHVVLDANHPLAGIALRLHLTVVAVRDATEEELERHSAGTGFFRLQPMAPGSPNLH